MSLTQVVISLKKIQDLNKDSHKIDLENFERKIREIINELSTKRLQVEQLRNELDCANVQIHDLKRIVESSKITIREKEFNLEIAKDNNTEIREKLQNHLQLSTKMKIQYESAIVENKNLRELLQQLEVEKCELNRKLKDGELQHQNDLSYQNDLTSKNSKIEAKTQELNRKLEDIQKKQEEILCFMNSLTLCEDLNHKIAAYKEELQRCNQRKIDIEKKYISAKATADKLTQFINNSSFYSNFEDSKSAVEEWKLANANLNNEIKQIQRVVENLTETLKMKEEENRKLCEWQTKIEEQNSNLKKKIQVFSDKKYENISTQTDNLEEMVKSAEENNDEKNSHIDFYENIKNIFNLSVQIQN